MNALSWTCKRSELEPVIGRAVRWAWWWRHGTPDRRGQYIDFSGMALSDIYAALQYSGFDWQPLNYNNRDAAVYRRLTNLEKKGVVKRLRGYGRYAYWLPADPLIAVIADHAEEFKKSLQNKPVGARHWVLETMEKLVPGCTDGWDPKPSSIPARDLWSNWQYQHFAAVVGHAERTELMVPIWERKAGLHIQPIYKMDIGMGVMQTILNMALAEHERREREEAEEE